MRFTASPSSRLSQWSELASSRYLLVPESHHHSCNSRLYDGQRFKLCSIGKMFFVSYPSGRVSSPNPSQGSHSRLEKGSKIGRTWSFLKLQDQEILAHTNVAISPILNLIFIWPQLAPDRPISNVSFITEHLLYRPRRPLFFSFSFLWFNPKFIFCSVKETHFNTMGQRDRSSLLDEKLSTAYVVGPDSNSGPAEVPTPASETYVPSKRTWKSYLWSSKPASLLILFQILSYCIYPRRISSWSLLGDM